MDKAGFVFAVRSVAERWWDLADAVEISPGAARLALQRLEQAQAVLRINNAGRALAAALEQLEL